MKWPIGLENGYLLAKRSHTVIILMLAPLTLVIYKRPSYSVCILSRRTCPSYAVDSGVSILLVNILEPTQILDDHLQYRYHVKIRVEVQSVGSTFKNVVLVDPYSINLLGNYLSDPSQLILHATAYCASCSAMQVPKCSSGSAPLPKTISPSFYHRASKVMSQCSCLLTTSILGSLRLLLSGFRPVTEDPLAFILPPSIEGHVTVLMSFDDFNTRFSHAGAHRGRIQSIQDEIRSLRGLDSNLDGAFRHVLHSSILDQER